MSLCEIVWPKHNERNVTNKGGYLKKVLVNEKINMQDINMGVRSL